jgi:hypothetical protein
VAALLLARSGTHRHLILALVKVGTGIRARDQIWQLADRKRSSTFDV